MPGSVLIKIGAQGYQMEPLFYNAMDSSSAAVLTIPAARNTADVLYTCVIESHEHGRTTKKSIRNYVNSYVYGEHQFLDAIMSRSVL